VREWLPALGLGLATVLLWAVPLVALSGGWALYRRATAALLTDFYGASTSAFGARASWYAILSNVNVALIGGLIAAIPLVAWSRGREPWRRIVMATVALNLAFSAVFYCAETGYLIGIAALSCLVPATWPPTVNRLLRARIALALALGPVFLFLAPASLPLATSSRMDLPSFAGALARDAFQTAYGRLVCEAAGGQPGLALSDGFNMGPHRGAPLRCPNLRFASWLGRLELNRGVDSLIIVSARGMVALPTGIPLEVGPPVEYRVSGPVERVLLAPDASRRFVEEISRQALCPRMLEAERALGEDRVLVWPAHCFPRLQIGKNLLLLTASSSSPHAGSWDDVR
jgi:hypothetical protein